VWSQWSNDLADDGQVVVDVKVLRVAAVCDGLGEALCGVLGDKLIERAWAGAHGEDALDGVAVEGAVVGGTSESRVEVGGVVASAQAEDAARLEGPASRRQGAHQLKEALAAFSESGEGFGEALGIEGSGLAARGGSRSGRA